jgi:hypothetical protein
MHALASVVTLLGIGIFNHLYVNIYTTVKGIVDSSAIKRLNMIC